MRRNFLALAVLLITPVAYGQDLSEQKFFALGEFRLESGATIHDCRIGYRTAGELNPERSNAILTPSWFAGRSGDLGGWVGPGKLLDTTRYYVIAVDAFGDGVSSSPSNSAQKPFPDFSIRDMVRSQYELATRELKIERLNAVVGLSMGGMQAFQWVVTYPESMQKAVSIVGTPKQTSADIMLWSTELELIDSFSGSPDDMRKAMRAVADIQAIELRTPSWIARSIPNAMKELETHRKALEDRDPVDYMSQLRAMIGHDIGSPDGIKAPMLIVVALQDHMVNPGPARELAKKLGADVVTLTSDCGHLASGCERDVMVQEVQKFLLRP